MKAPKPKLPPVSEMVIESIKALKENPRKGSSLRDIRETIEMNWTVDWGKLCDKVKKYILNAEATGEILRVKGTKNKKERKGFNGRFTVPGLKPKKKKKKNELTKNGTRTKSRNTNLLRRRSVPSLKKQLRLSLSARERSVGLKKRGRQSRKNFNPKHLQGPRRLTTKLRRSLVTRRLKMEM